MVDRPKLRAPRCGRPANHLNLDLLYFACLVQHFVPTLVPNSSCLTLEVDRVKGIGARNIRRQTLQAVPRRILCPVFQATYNVFYIGDLHSIAPVLPLFPAAYSSSESATYGFFVGYEIILSSLNDDRFSFLDTPVISILYFNSGKLETSFVHHAVNAFRIFGRKPVSGLPAAIRLLSSTILFPLS